MHRGYVLVHFLSMAILSLGTALFVVLGTSGVGAAQEKTEAQQEQSTKLELDEVANSGVSGTADLRDVEDGVQITLTMQGLPEEGVEHLNHFHGGGRCSDVQNGENLPITIPLATIVADEDGTGSATTTLEGITLSRLFDRSQERVILVHDELYEGEEGIPAAISCADVNNAPSGEQAAMRESTNPLPKSGGVPVASVLLVPLTSVLVPLAAIVIGCGVLWYASQRRG